MKIIVCHLPAPRLVPNFNSPPALLSVPGLWVGGQPPRRGPDTGSWLLWCPSNSSPEGPLGPHVFSFTQCSLEVICAVDVADGARGFPGKVRCFCWDGVLSRTGSHLQTKVLSAKHTETSCKVSKMCLNLLLHKTKQCLEEGNQTLMGLGSRWENQRGRGCGRPRDQRGPQG